MDLFTFSIDANPIAAATAETILELATGASDRAKVVSWWVEFDGVTSTAIPAKVEAGRFSAAVTTATTGTAGKYDNGGPAPTATVKHTVTTEGAGTPEAGLETHRVHPQGGLLVQYPLGRELILAVSSFFRIRVTAAAGVNVTGGIVWEE
jgi:hypothetical protein